MDTYIYYNQRNNIEGTIQLPLKSFKDLHKVRTFFNVFCMSRLVLGWYIARNFGMAVSSTCCIPSIGYNALLFALSAILRLLTWATALIVNITVLTASVPMSFSNQSTLSLPINPFRVILENKLFLVNFFLSMPRHLSIEILRLRKTCVFRKRRWVFDVNCLSRPWECDILGRKGDDHLLLHRKKCHFPSTWLWPFHFDHLMKTCQRNHTLDDF